MPCFTLSAVWARPADLASWQDLQALVVADRFGQARPDEHVGGGAKGQAGAGGLAAALPDQLGVRSAGAQRDGDAARLGDDMGGPLPVEDLDRRLLGQRLLADQRAADLGAAGEHRPGERVVIGHVVVEQVRQLLHGCVLAHPHEGVLEEPDDDGREGDLALAVVLEVHDQPLGGHRVHHRAELCLAAAGPTGQGRHRADGRHPRRDLGLLDGEQQAEDLLEHRGVRRPGEHPVEALLQPLVGEVGIGERVPHGGPPGGRD